MKNLFAFLFGALFALGLMISGMSNPVKVLGFLDVLGEFTLADLVKDRDRMCGLLGLGIPTQTL